MNLFSPCRLRICTHRRRIETKNLYTITFLFKHPLLVHACSYTPPSGYIHYTDAEGGREGIHYGACPQRWAKGPIDQSSDTDSIFRFYRTIQSVDVKFRFLYRPIVSVRFEFRFFNRPILFLGIKFRLLYRAIVSASFK